jgi:hypothetical protein
MNNALKVFFAGLAACVFIYLGVAFITWDFNAANWTSGLRGFVVLCGGIMCVLISILLDAEIPKK